MEESDEQEVLLPEKGREILSDPLKLKQLIDEGKTFQDIIGYTEDTMDRFYRAACRLFDKQKYEESADAFVFLTTMNPFVSHYWLALGMSEHLIEEHFGAIIAYNMASILDNNNPIPHYHAASCYKALHDLENAKLSLEAAMAAAGDHVQHATLKQRAQTAAELIKKNDN